MQFHGEAKFASIAASGHCRRKTTVKGSGVSMPLIAPKSTCRDEITPYGGLVMRS